MKIQEYLASPRKKRAYNRALFGIIAPRYNLATRLLSFFRDQRWKKTLIRDLPDKPARVIVDFACGTGDITFMLRQKYPAARIIAGIDLTAAMLAAARGCPGALRSVRLIQADMQASPLRDCCADIVTGGYALRNAPDLAAFLAEVRRVLAPGGIAAFLDFSRPRLRAAGRLRHGLLLAWGWFWGWALHRDRAVYAYIAESLSVFPDSAELFRIIARAGFTGITARTFFLGTIAIVAFSKPADT